MSSDQTVSAAFGFVIEDKEIDAFIDNLIEVFKKYKDESNKMTEVEKENFSFYPSITYLTNNSSWSDVGFNRLWDQDGKVSALLIYDKSFLHSIDNRYEVSLPAALFNPSEYFGPLLEFAPLVGYKGPFSWFFSAEAH